MLDQGIIIFSFTITKLGEQTLCDTKKQVTILLTTRTGSGKQKIDTFHKKMKGVKALLEMLVAYFVAGIILKC